MELSSVPKQDEDLQGNTFSNKAMHICIKKLFTASVYTCTATYASVLKLKKLEKVLIEMTL
jgi:hypothetical protein